MKYYFILLLAFTFTLSQAQISEQELDNLVNQTLEAFTVPGISVGIYKDGKVIYAKGHGVKAMKTQEAMNEETLVGVASNSKGFTCFAISMLIDEGKIRWDDKVRKYIPEFKLYDPWVTEEFTIRDLVTHRSGYPLGGGDLMFFPDGNNFTVDDVIAGVQHVPPLSSFRSNYMYNNNMYIIAGEVIKRVSGMEWTEFIEEKIMKPVGMTNSKGSYARVTDKSNIIEAHTRADGVVIQIPHDWSETANAAGGIISNVPDMLIWAEFLMNGGVTKEGKRLISEERMWELWSLQTPKPVRPNNSYDTHFSGYALGWNVSNVKQYKQVTHTGGLIGTVTQFTMIPDLDLAIVVLTNQMVGAAFTSITNTIKDSYLGYGDRNWLGKNKERMDAYYARMEAMKKEVYDKVEAQKSTSCPIDQNNIVGTFTDKWFGDIVISHDGSDYNVKCVKSPRLFGKMYHYEGSTFVIKWNDRSYDADVYVNFSMDEKGKAQNANMKYIAPITDFSFDFHDLRLKRTK